MAMKDLKAVPEELTFIVSDPKGWELGFVRDVDSIDLDLGDTNDFELQIDAFHLVAGAVQLEKPDLHSGDGIRRTVGGTANLY